MWSFHYQQQATSGTLYPKTIRTYITKTNKQQRTERWVSNLKIEMIHTHTQHIYIYIDRKTHQDFATDDQA